MAMLNDLLSLLSTISLSKSQDTLIWKPTQGSFSTSEAHKLIRSSSSIHTPTQHWNVIWKLKVLPEIINFIWKLAWGALPTKSILSQRLKTTDSSCQWCTLSPETLSHLFWECQLATWALSFIQSWWNISRNTFYRASNNLFRLLKFFSQKHINRIWKTVVAATLWTIWLARNEAIFNDVRLKQTDIHELIQLRVSIWGMASGIIPFSHIPTWKVNSVGTINVHHHLDVSNYWKIRLENFFAVCMVDAAWLPNCMAKGGIGGVIKNKWGRIIYSFSGPAKAQNILEAEISALLHVFNVIRTSHLHMHKLVVCSDSILAIDSIYEGLEKTFPLLAPNYNINSLLQNSVTINLVPSVINVEAETLAKNGASKTFISCRWALEQD
ncbi:hypothetical protein DCAR_0623398 [Daucus carota subsp. sativus]|uniref:Reverse transcriptase zinc-binding domain-containing protein n=1 Tax=Daucus carota subsp. sativus TaxID=79200 RepID=A0AAF0X9L4_DAUCS|nr:PREDICTED: uncharacterized protein LOC108225855 [Daucus carota subsp. sativus]WOH03993.1 hypothetical protein DCAR_0623398 [Daucus carota subsp. sativus]